MKSELCGSLENSFFKYILQRVEKLQTFSYSRGPGHSGVPGWFHQGQRTSSILIPWQFRVLQNAWSSYSELIWIVPCRVLTAAMVSTLHATTHAAQSLFSKIILRGDTPFCCAHVSLILISRYHCTAENKVNYVNAVFKLFSVKHKIHKLKFSFAQNCSSSNINKQQLAY